MAARVWTCRKCSAANPRRLAKCPTLGCTGKRPPKTEPAHRAVLEVPYEKWVARFGERCALCGRPPATTKLHRDHDHRTGMARGLLCHRCNRGLPDWVTVDWLQKAIEYVKRGDPDHIIHIDESGQDPT